MPQPRDSAVTLGRPQLSPPRGRAWGWSPSARRDGSQRVRLLIVKISVVRSGGFAGLTVQWSLRVEEQADRDEWIALVDELPWEDRWRVAGEPDRFTYLIRVSRRQITLPETRVEGPWRELVDRVRATGQASRVERRGGSRHPDPKKPDPQQPDAQQPEPQQP